MVNIKIQNKKGRTGRGVAMIGDASKCVVDWDDGKTSKVKILSLITL